MFESVTDGITTFWGSQSFDLLYKCYNYEGRSDCVINVPYKVLILDCLWLMLFAKLHFRADLKRSS